LIKKLKTNNNGPNPVMAFEAWISSPLDLRFFGLEILYYSFYLGFLNVFTTAPGNKNSKNV